MNVILRGLLLFFLINSYQIFLLRLVFFLDHVFFCPWRCGRGWMLWRQAEWCLGRPIQRTLNLGPSEGTFASKLAGGSWCFLLFSKIWLRCHKNFGSCAWGWTWYHMQINFKSVHSFSLLVNFWLCRLSAFDCQHYCGYSSVKRVEPGTMHFAG